MAFSFEDFLTSARSVGDGDGRGDGWSHVFSAL